MTDTERERRKAICKVAGVKEIDDLSDGFHTFRQLYYQRMMLFATIVKQNRDRAWKSVRHENGDLCFGGGWFVVGIDTPEGSYTYHYEFKYFDLFDCKILDYGKHWDGHTEKDVTRLFSLPSAEPERLTDDDFETIRIHLNAQKEKLCNQQRWEEAEEYQRIIDRFMAFASAEPEIIRCRDCKNHVLHPRIGVPWCKLLHSDMGDNQFCSYAERREVD